MTVCGHVRVLLSNLCGREHTNGISLVLLYLYKQLGSCIYPEEVQMVTLMTDQHMPMGVATHSTSAGIMEKSVKKITVYTPVAV